MGPHQRLEQTAVVWQAQMQKFVRDHEILELRILLVKIGR